MGKASRMRRREARNTRHDERSNSDDDYDNRQSFAEMMFHICQFQEIENEIMDLYTKKFGYDPREPQKYKFFSEEEQIERHAQNIVFWRKLEDEYGVKEMNDICKVLNNPRWTYIKRKGDEVSMAIYMKFKDLDGVNERIEKRVRELMNE